MTINKLTLAAALTIGLMAGTCRMPDIRLSGRCNAFNSSLPVHTCTKR